MRRGWVIFLTALVPAIIAGMFSIAPKIYDLITEPSARLSYSILSGPTIELAGDNQQIINIKVNNDGKKILHEIKGRLVVSNGTIRASALSSNTGIDSTINGTNKYIDIKAKIMHPKESLSLSFLISKESEINNISFNLRSIEVLGSKILLSDGNDRSEIKFSFIGSALAALSVFLMVGILFGNKSNFAKLILGGKQDILVYIAGRVGLSQLSEEIRRTPGISYKRVADMFLSEGVAGDDETRKKCIRGLRSLLLIEHVNEESLIVIRGNIKILDSSFGEKDYLKLRDESKDYSSERDLRNAVEKISVV